MPRGRKRKAARYVPQAWIGSSSDDGLEDGQARDGQGGQVPNIGDDGDAQGGQVQNIDDGAQGDDGDLRDGQDEDRHARDGQGAQVANIGDDGDLRDGQDRQDVQAPDGQDRQDEAMVIGQGGQHLALGAEPMDIGNFFQAFIKISCGKIF